MTNPVATYDDGRRSPSKAELRRRQLAFTSNLLFETPGGVRYTQDSPILPNVWLAFATEPRSQQELILTTTTNHGAGLAARELRRDLAILRKKRPMVGEVNQVRRERARVSYIPGQIAVKLYIDELMRVVLPLTSWWHTTYSELRKVQRDLPGTSADWHPFPQPDQDVREDQDIGRREQDLLDALMHMRREIDSTGTLPMEGDPAFAHESERIRYVREMPPSLIWLVRIAGLIGDSFASGTEMLTTSDSLSSDMERDFRARDHDRIETTSEREERVAQQRLDRDAARATRRGMVEAFTHLYDNWVAPGESYPETGYLWRVTKNRRVHLAVAKSALTVKADAARSLFDISCQNLTWAVLDSGIDGRHPAFRLTTEEHEEEKRRTCESDLPRDELPVDALDSRVVKTLDFTYLRELLDYDIDGAAAESEERRQSLLKKIACRMSPGDCDCIRGGECNPSDEKIETAVPVLDRLRERISEGKEINWQDLESAVVAENPPPPINDHGTHVAGIIGADWIEDFKHERDLPLAQRTRRMVGICPDIKLIDARVFREDGLTDEFELLAAIQFLRWMNSRAGTMQVHGANLSLSLIHEVRRFACGQTPICEECNEAVALGMVIVAAAGNRGFEMDEADEVRASDSYKSVSITDPGNAANVITVGATHRKRPHEYGVSYFSSRGPTGDGRAKPDLVAPGEKIKGPTPNGRAEFKDGTSMAAPHVSGVAALLMARHGELIGKPERIKSILCDTATDLGRERYFQGHGLVDALRALQSV